MSVPAHLRDILEELTRNSAHVADQQLSRAVREITDARHVFLAGAGRSGVAITGSANRLMHLGKSVSLVGEITSPPPPRSPFPAREPTRQGRPRCERTATADFLGSAGPAGEAAAIRGGGRPAAKAGSGRARNSAVDTHLDRGWPTTVAVSHAVW